MEDYDRWGAEGNWNEMMDVMLREEGEGENLRKMEDWRDKRREEKKQVGKRRGRREEWKKRERRYGRRSVWNVDVSGESIKRKKR